MSSGARTGADCQEPCAGRTDEAPHSAECATASAGQKKTPREAGCRSLACVWRSVVLVVIRSMRTVSDERSRYIPDPCFLISVIPWRFLCGFAVDENR